MSGARVFNMPSGVPFLPALATGLKATFGEDLQNALILLPTRRAVRSLGDAFVSEGSASLLPRMRPLADIDPEEPPFEPGELAGLVKPSIAPMRRRFELAKLVAKYHDSTAGGLPLDPSGALLLADPLIAILDDAAMEEASSEDLSGLVEIAEFAAAHFQNAAVFYNIIQEHWPKHLANMEVMEPMARRVALLNALDRVWKADPPQYPVIIAGSTGTLKATRRLMKRVTHLPRGMIVLPGLDKNIREDDVWADISDEHPQNALKRLIEALGVERGNVPDWTWAKPYETANMRARRQVISESLVPAGSTSDWPSRIESIKTGAGDDKPFEQAIKGLSVIEARTDEEEALAVALIMREALEDKDKTAALVTPDPALARRVRTRLRRWGVDADNSQGEPLEETALGAFLSGIMRLAQDPENPVDLAFLCKHKLSHLGRPGGEARQAWERLERQVYHGIRPSSEVLDKATEETETKWLLNDLNEAMSPLLGIVDDTTANQWARAIAEVAENLAASDAISGTARLWVDDAGEKAASLLEDLIAHGDILPSLTFLEFSALLATLMRGRVVRARYGTHPRLSILGPLEARMLQADMIILGGLNEGVWPARPTITPFLSQGMRQKIGLSLPERRYGLAAHDFAELAANPNVILTRAERSDDSPAIASRWLWRLQTLVKGALGDEGEALLQTAQPYLDWARALDDVPPDAVTSADQPEPAPPVEQRWPGDRGRQLSVTQIQKWIRDPYSIYAKHILGLAPLDDLDMPLGPREYGNAIHKGLETFAHDYPKNLPGDAEGKLISAIEAGMGDAGFEGFQIAKDKSRLKKIAVKVIEWMTERRATGWVVRSIEERGEIKLMPENFTLTGKPDLIEKGIAGFAVNDYKTGAPATVKVVKAGFDPQLPLTAFMIAEGAFPKLGKGETEELNYIRIKGSGNEDLIKTITPPAKGAESAMDYAADAVNALRKLIAAFDKPDTAYTSQPRVQYTYDYGDYDHLARRDEWGLGSDEKGGVNRD